MAKLITETSYDIQVKEEEEEEKQNQLYIYGIFSTAEKTNENQRVYSKEILEREVNKYMSHVKERTALGELNHPPQPDVNPERAAILVENLEWKGNDLLGKARVLENTPQGSIVKALLENNVKLGVSSRGLGDVNEDGYVADNYTLITWDVIGRPSCQNAWVNGVYEGAEFPSPKEMKEKNSTMVDFGRVKSKLDNIIRDYKKRY